MLTNIITQLDSNPATNLTVHLDTIERPTLGTRRVGGQRTKWLDDSLQYMWNNMQTLTTSIHNIP